MPAESRPLDALLGTLLQVGRVVWIGVRPARRASVVACQSAEAVRERGLAGDRFGGGGKREVTLIQAEHLAAVGSFLSRGPIDAAFTRRNIVVAGINLLALEGRAFRIGDAVLEKTGLCHPCSRMEEALGPGGYNAMRGHGGITARILEGGAIRVGDTVAALARRTG